MADVFGMSASLIGRLGRPQRCPWHHADHASGALPPRACEDDWPISRRLCTLMFSPFAFGYLFGFVGLLIAVPLAAARSFCVWQYYGSRFGQLRRRWQTSPHQLRPRPAGNRTDCDEQLRFTDVISSSPSIHPAVLETMRPPIPQYSFEFEDHCGNMSISTSFYRRIEHAHAAI